MHDPLKENDVARLKDEYFKEHVATLEQQGTLQRLLWAEPERYSCSMVFIFSPGILCVSGDLGSAVFRFGNSFKDIRQLTGFDISYMAGKCEASEAGRNYWTWSPATAIDDITRQYQYDIKGREPSESEQEAYENIKGIINRLDINTHDAMCQVLLDDDDDMVTLFGEDWVHSFYDLGMRYHERMKLMYIGLKMALESLN
jgi:hypothetical protein